VLFCVGVHLYLVVPVIYLTQQQAINGRYCAGELGGIDVHMYLRMLNFWQKNTDTLVGIIGSILSTK
jgi:hypothetical protein